MTLGVVGLAVGSDDPGKPVAFGVGEFSGVGVDVVIHVGSFVRRRRLIAVVFMMNWLVVGFRGLSDAGCVRRPTQSKRALGARASSLRLRSARGASTIQRIPGRRDSMQHFPSTPQVVGQKTVTAGVRDTSRPIDRELGIRGATRSKTTVTTRSDRSSPRAPDLVNRRFRAERPNQLWVCDFERHEALLNRAVMKGHRHRSVAADWLKLRAA